MLLYQKKQLRRDLNTTSEVDAAQEELGLEGATADDTESEHIREVRDVGRWRGGVRERCEGGT